MQTTPYVAVPNSFRQRLIAGERLIGCWCSMASPIVAEVLGLAGFDWVVIDGEHAPNEISTFIPQLTAMKDSVSAPVVRPQWNDTVLIKRLLDIGFYNFVIPYVEGEADAKRAVAATRYPPQGVRGVSLVHRGSKFGTIKDYLKQINDSITVMVQIESRTGVENIDEIVAVEGVDAVFIGPQDLAAGFGHLGNPSHPEVQAAMEKVFAAAKAAGKASGILAPDEADARRYFSLGATVVAVGSDLSVFRSGTQNLRNKYLD